MKLLQLLINSKSVKKKKIELKLLRAAKNRYVSNFDHYLKLLNPMFRHFTEVTLRLISHPLTNKMWLIRKCWLRLISKAHQKHLSSLAHGLNFLSTRDFLPKVSFQYPFNYTQPLNSTTSLQANPDSKQFYWFKRYFYPLWRPCQIALRKRLTALKWDKPLQQVCSLRLFWK